MSLRALYDLAAPAKINLFLHVVGRRADGYHLLESVFVLIDWTDTLHIERRNDGHWRATTWAPPCRPTTCACAPHVPCSRPARLRWAPTSASSSGCPGAPAWAAAVRTPPPPCWP
jgi:hypothetical protein